MTKTVKILLAVLATLALAAGGAAVAQTTGPEAVQAATPHPRERPIPIRGDLTVWTPDGQTKQVHMERGKVSEVTESGFTLTAPDGVVNHVVVDDQTKILPPGAELADFDGRPATVIAETKDGDNWVAAAVRSPRRHR